ncbi:hypothetical protein A51_020824 [Vibrio cholerae MZO-3]|uniref:Uncharacterized protein n=1 Tax=Vibrio cholerae O37 TaxID=185332 RepID=H9CJG0_VIBCL|nr:hypothetical protein [Vibrio cholerae]AFD29055.1 hypothetical protein [Vibrio cholerae O37]KNA50571.1 hypothetical protein A51_020824 [Vibrio cholerae MZO-3]
MERLELFQTLDTVSWFHSDDLKLQSVRDAFDLAKKRGRVHEFKDEQDQKFFGVCVDRTANELIAIHFKEQFGDGIYYRQMSNGEDVYFLVIHQGCIVSGTDKLINQKMLESVLPLFQQRFPELEVKKLTTTDFDEMVNVENERKQASLRRKRKWLIISVLLSSFTIGMIGLIIAGLIMK